MTEFTVGMRVEDSRGIQVTPRAKVGDDVLLFDVNRKGSRRPTKITGVGRKYIRIAGHGGLFSLDLFEATGAARVMDGFGHQTIKTPARAQEDDLIEVASKRLLDRGVDVRSSKIDVLALDAFISKMLHPLPGCDEDC